MFTKGWNIYISVGDPPLSTGLLVLSCFSQGMICCFHMQLTNPHLSRKVQRQVALEEARASSEAKAAAEAVGGFYR